MELETQRPDDLVPNDVLVDARADVTPHGLDGAAEHDAHVDPRMAAAIAWLSERYAEQPSLESAAAAVGMSPYHFQRRFTESVGVSPKKYVQFLTLEHAKKVLRSNESVLEAAYDAGLSGPGRLHDLFVAHEAMTPGQWKARGAGLDLRYGWHESPFGQCLVVATEQGVCGLGFERGSGKREAFDDLMTHWPKAEPRQDPELTAPFAAAAFGHPKGDLRLMLRGTPFQLKVWEALLRIPPGSVVTYTDIARALDRPDAVRAVASAIARNPISWLIPCHRVLRQTGALAGYRWDLHRKRAMLAIEGAATQPDPVE
jgi:AraC family transcriptional regulator of adaptative response/methylated-DNA-[protein]-cysteine methyltransferase